MQRKSTTLVMSFGPLVALAILPWPADCSEVVLEDASAQGASTQEADPDRTLLVESSAFSDLILAEDGPQAIADYGDPAGQLAALATARAIPISPESGRTGEWSATYPWPLSPIHASLLSDGSVLTYGTNGGSANGPALGFDVDRQYLGSGPGMGAHEMSPTGIDTNIFCSSQMVLPSGDLLLSGGDALPLDGDDSRKDRGVNATTLYARTPDGCPRKAR